MSLEADEAILWCRQKRSGHPYFSPMLLDDLQIFWDRMQQYGGDAAPFRHVVWCSDTPGVYSLGGDLRLIMRLAETQDRAALTRYARQCIEMLHNNVAKHELPIVTVALVEGEALGGGFEAALSCDVIIAEESARFGLPEVLFNLFPGMGAYSFLARRIGVAKAEEMIFSGRVYGAGELVEMGVVDQVVADGEGHDAVYAHIDRTARQFSARRALYKVRRRFAPLEMDELTDIVDLWVDAALDLDRGSLRRMDRLATAQERRHPVPDNLAG